MGMPSGFRIPLHSAQGQSPRFRSMSMCGGDFQQLRVACLRTLVFLGLHWGSPILGNYHIRFMV